MKFLTVILFFTFLSTASLSADSTNDIEFENNQTFLTREQETGLVKKASMLRRNGLRFSLSYHLPKNIVNAKVLNGFEVNLAKNFDDYFVQLHFYTMGAVFTELVEATNLYPINSETYTTRESFTSIGLGYGVRTFIFRDLISAKKSFETMSFSLSYDSFAETFSRDLFSGIGYQMALGVFTHLTEKFYYGTTINYHMSNLRRPQVFLTETTSNRSLTLSWLTIGINLSMYLD